MTQSSNLPEGGGPEAGYFCIKRSTSGDKYKLVFFVETSPSPLLNSWTKLCDDPNVQSVDFTSVKPWNTENIASIAVRFVVRSNVEDIVIPNHRVLALRGRCCHLLFEALPNILKNDIEMYGCEIKLKEIVDFRHFTHKIVGRSWTRCEDVGDIVRTLQDIHRIKEPPHDLVIAVMQAYKFLRKFLRKKKRVGQKSRFNAQTAEEACNELDDSECSDPSEYSDNNTNSPTLPTKVLCGKRSNRSPAESRKRKRAKISHKRSVDNNDQTEDDASTSTPISFQDPCAASKCYVCKSCYHFPTKPPALSKVRRQYPRMCLKCAEFNYKKRHQRTDLQGKYAVVTGGRIKIGYITVLKMLQDGCHVVTTTRFPRDAAKRFADEPDYEDWGERLKIYPLDLKNADDIYEFTKYVKETFPHLDILINNAAQTLHRPPRFYQHLFDSEHLSIDNLPSEQRTLLATSHTLTYPRLPPSTNPETLGDEGNDMLVDQSPPDEKVCKVDDVSDANSFTIDQKDLTDCANYLSGTSGKFAESDHEGRHTDSVVSNSPTPDYVPDISEAQDHVPDIPESQDHVPDIPESQDHVPDIPESQDHVPDNPEAHLVPAASCSTVCVETMDSLEDRYFPSGCFDDDGQQVDLRPTNSWRAVLDNVPVGELLEVLMVNTIAPFILTQELKPCMDRSPAKRKFVVNVSAMEGQFGRTSKTKFHPHTNMAKAALNMMTRTAALGYQEAGVYMTAVDTGWVTDERPFHQATHERDVKGFTVPLDSEDGAARVYDPICMGLNRPHHQPYYAVFLKNYSKYPW